MRGSTSYTEMFFYLFVLTFPFSFLSVTQLHTPILVAGIDDILILLSIPIIFFSYTATARSKKIFIDRHIILSIKAIISLTIFVFLTDVYQNKGITSTIQHVGFLLTFILVIYCIDDIRKFSTVISLLKISIFIISLSAIITSLNLINVRYMYDYSIETGSYRRAMPGFKTASTGLMHARGGFGVNVSFILPFILNSIFTHKRKFALVTNILIFVLIIVSVYASGSRSTWLATIVTVSFFTNKYFTSKLDKKLTIASSFLIASLLYITVLSSGQLIEKIYHISPEGVDSRMAINMQAINSFINNPLFGSDIGILQELSGTHIVIHNFFISYTKNGIGAIISLAIFFINLFIINKRTSQSQISAIFEYSYCLSVGMIGIIIELFFYGGGEKQIWMYFALICSLYIASLNKTKAYASQQ